jgi:phage gpG-like protein
MITAKLMGDGALLSRLRALPGAINSALIRAITKLAIDLQDNVRQNKLSGTMLSVRSGSLKSSIDVRLDQKSTAIAATIFSDSGYARVHEYGFSGTVSVRESLRRITEAFGRPISGTTVNVRAHSRKMELPERSFLRSALEDLAPSIRDEVEAALGDTIPQ